MSFGQLFGKPKISHHSLDGEFRPVRSSNSASIGGDGAFNAGVFVVRRKPDERKCVEKRFNARDVLNGRAEFEMFALRELSHKNVVEYLHAFIELNPPQASMYMEFADLGTLEDRIVTNREQNKYPAESAVWYLAMQLANAVSYLQYGVRDASSDHQSERRSQPGWIGIVHRDIKPANIFLRTDTAAPLPRIILGDFGQAIREDNDNWDRVFEGGDRHWMAPEAPPWNYEADVWAVGASIQATCRLGGQPLPRESQNLVGAGRRYSAYMTDGIIALMATRPRDRMQIRDFALEAGNHVRRAYRDEGGPSQNHQQRGQRHR